MRNQMLGTLERDAIIRSQLNATDETVVLTGRWLTPQYSDAQLTISGSR